MKLEMPWSSWFNKQAKKRRKVEPWVLATISLEEEFEVEMILREVFDYIDPDDIPDLISAFAMENFRLTKIIKCEEKWCKAETDRFKGWLKRESLWGLL